MAAGQNRLRGKEAQLQIYRNGTPLTGDFLLVSNWSVTPDQEIRTQQFTGEKRARNDLNIRGYDGNITCHLRNHLALEIANDINRAERDGRPNADYVFVLLLNYRDAPVRQITLEDECILAMPSIEASEDDYVTVTMDFRSRDMATA